MKLYEILHKSAEAALEKQGTDGSMPPGHNGPYMDEETPVRNTGHWLITFLKVYEITGEKAFLDAAEKAVGFLLSSKARPMGAAFWHRKNPEKDFANGLIGQAWSIEALCAAAGHFNAPEITAVARDVFLAHPFDSRRGLWRGINVDGSYLPVDRTFNHQLWLAAAGALIPGSGDTGEIAARVKTFMDRIRGNLVLYPSGLIAHDIRQGNPAKRAYAAARNVRRGSERISKAAGYHQFNLHGFALLKTRVPGHRFWKGRLFRKLWKYSCGADYILLLEKSAYGFPYNPPGFEIPFALEVFCGDDPDRKHVQQRWLSEQVRRCLNPNSFLMTENTPDPETAAARIYEATRLPDMDAEDA